MSHLTPDELLDAVDGESRPSVQAHLEGCVDCRDEVARLARLLDDVRSLDAPEPSPLFWTHWSARVRAAIDASPSQAVRGWGRPAWRVVAPLAAAAMVVLAVGLWRMPARVAPVVPVIDDTPGADVEDAPEPGAWLVLSDLVGDLDWDVAAESGEMLAPGTADEAVNALSGEERQELSRLLAEELGRASS